jgi:hypothetical protein
MMLPPTGLWPPRTQMAFIALIASVLGAATLTGMVAWLIWIFAHGAWAAATAPQRLTALAFIAYGTLFIVGLTITALGMAINRRSIRVTGPGGISGEISGGSDTESGGG